MRVTRAAVRVTHALLDDDDELLIDGGWLNEALEESQKDPRACVSIEHGWFDDTDSRCVYAHNRNAVKT